MTDNKLADALRDIQQYLQMTAPSPDCGHLLQITVDALAEHDAQPAPDECFCDRMYPDSNPNASCGDCPTRDYGAQPAPAPVQVDGAGELPPLPAAEYRVSPDSQQPSLYDEDALRVFLRDYEMTHGTGDLEMQPALHQARKALARHDAEKGKADGDYVLVPRVPTETMLAAVAGWTESTLVCEDDTVEYPVSDETFSDAYEAMIAAAPAQPPAPAPVQPPANGESNEHVALLQELLRAYGDSGFTEERAAFRAAIAALQQKAVCTCSEIQAVHGHHFGCPVRATGNEGEGK